MILTKIKRPAVESIIHWFLICIACVVVVEIYILNVLPGVIHARHFQAKKDYYNLLVQGFQAGQLNVKAEVPSGLVELGEFPDPINQPNNWVEHNPNKDRNWMYDRNVYDLSYYKNKLYLYFGVAPALLLFWPYLALTNHYISQPNAVIFFFSVGFLISAGLLCAIWRRYFAEISVWTVVVSIFALGLANLIPPTLHRAAVYEVAISCGYALTMLSLAAVWLALHHLRRQWLWIAIASLIFGLAVASRPSLLLGAIILLVPIMQAWRENRKIWPLMLSACLPITLIGFGIMYYNQARFDHPLEFGQHYQLPIMQRTEGTYQFSLDYLKFNWQVGFLEPAHTRSIYPFVSDIKMPEKPKGLGTTKWDHPFGVLANIPMTWLAFFAAPLLLISRNRRVFVKFHWFLLAVVLLFTVNALTLCLHDSMAVRYELEYTDMLIFLAILMIFVIEKMLCNKPVWRRIARFSWGLLLVVSIAFNLLIMQELRVWARTELMAVVRVQDNEIISKYWMAD